jgi:GAF domain-containing protein
MMLPTEQVGSIPRPAALIQGVHGFEAGRISQQAGDGLDHLERVKISWGEGTEAGQGPFGIAVRTGKDCWVDDIGTDPKFSPWRVAALARGYASCIAVPLMLKSSFVLL